MFIVFVFECLFCLPRSWGVVSMSCGVLCMSHGFVCLFLKCYMFIFVLFLCCSDVLCMWFHLSVYDARGKSVCVS